MFFASQNASIGYLNYIQTIWEYPPGRYGIIGGICGLVLIVVICIVCICIYKQNHQQTQLEGPRPYYVTVLRRPPRGPGGPGQQLVAKMRRWSRRSPRPFSSFIPTGWRHTPNYTGAMSDANITPYRGRDGMYRENYPSYIGQRDRWL